MTEEKKEPQVESIPEPIIEVQKSVEQLPIEETIEKVIEPIVEEVIEKTLTKEEVQTLLKDEPKSTEKACSSETTPKKETKAIEPVTDVSEDEAVYYEDITVEIEALKTALGEILSVVKDIQAKQTQPVEKPIVKTEEVVVEKAVELPIQKSLTAEEVTSIVEKAFDTKVGRIRLVPSRKGTLIKTDLDMKDENSEDIESLYDEGKFNKLTPEKRQDLIRKSLMGIICGK